MTKKKRKHRTTASKKKRSKSPSLAIPIAVGVVVVVVLFGGIYMIERQRSASAGAPGDGSVALDTAAPLDTSQVPYPEVPRIDLQEAQDMVESGEAIMVDVRSGASYEKAHVAGALSLPEEQVEARLGELPSDKDMIFY